MSLSQADATLDALLEQLHRGDVAAAEQIFLRYEPFLRMLVRRQLTGSLRAKFDSQDIVQSVWVDLLHGFRAAGWRFKDPAHLRAFLVKVTRNRLIDRRRRHGKRAETPLACRLGEEGPAAQQCGPGEHAQAEELWGRLLELCPPEHHRLLLLKRQGCDLAEIARQTGLHPSSVRRILYELARRLALADRSV